MVTGRPYETQGEEFIFERAKKNIPAPGRVSLREQPLKPSDQGLIEHFHRHNKNISLPSKRVKVARQCSTDPHKTRG